MADADKRPVRAAIYCRISLATHGDRVKVKRQEKLCRQQAERLGWDVVHVYCDNNQSAWQRNRTRPDWDAMLASVDSGDLNAIIVYHGDRLIRQPWDLELLLNLADGRGIHLASPVGTRNLDDAEDRYRLRIDVAQACKESDNISRRTKDAHADRAAKGIVRRGGNRPFGYKRSGKIKEGEAAEYRDVVARMLAGESRRSIVREWNARGFLTTRGNKWSIGTLSLVLKNPRYAGLSVYRGEVVGKGKWKPLVERDTWEALQATMQAIADHHKFAPVTNTSSKYLLTYIAFHAGCGSGMQMHHNGRNSALGYACSDKECPAKVRRNMLNVDEFVIGRVLRRLADDRLWAAMTAEDDDNSAGAELVALVEKRRATKEQFADSDTMSAVELDAVLRRLDARIAVAQSRVVERQKVHVLAGCRNLTRAEWDALPIDRRRAVVRATVTVELLPSKRGRYFDPTSVRVLPVLHGSETSEAAR